MATLLLMQSVAATASPACFMASWAPNLRSPSIAAEVGLLSRVGRQTCTTSQVSTTLRCKHSIGRPKFARQTQAPVHAVRMSASNRKIDSVWTSAANDKLRAVCTAALRGLSDAHDQAVHRSTELFEAIGPSAPLRSSPSFDDSPFVF